MFLQNECRYTDDRLLALHARAGASLLAFPFSCTLSLYATNSLHLKVETGFELH